MWTTLIVLVVAALAERAGYYRNNWQLVHLRMQLAETIERHDDRIDQWHTYAENVETELDQLRQNQAISAETLRQDLRTANATINRLEGSLQQSDAAYEDLLAQHRAARALRTPTDAWAQRLTMPVERETTGAVFDQETENEVVAEKRAALATVTRIPVKSYPAKSRPRRKRRR